ncbi:uncharacterized protein [Apostichopus japonicus]
MDSRCGEVNSTITVWLEDWYRCSYWWIVISCTFVLGSIVSLCADRCVRKYYLQRYVSKVKRQLSKKKEHNKLKAMINYTDERGRKDSEIPEICENLSYKAETCTGDQIRITKRQGKISKHQRGVVTVKSKGQVKTEQQEMKKKIMKPPLPPPKVPALSSRITTGGKPTKPTPLKRTQILS